VIKKKDNIEIQTR